MPRKKLPAHLRRPVGRPTLYPWSTWFDGQMHIIRPEVDFDCSVESMRQQVYLRARKEKIRVAVRQAHDGLVVEAVPNTPAEVHRYDWDTWLDGEVHQINIKDEIRGKLSNFRAYARIVAHDRGLRLISRVVGSLLIVQAVPRDTPVVQNAAAKLEPAPPAAPLDELPFAIEDPLLDPRPFR